MASAASNTVVYKDDFLGRDYRSTLYSVSKSAVYVPGNPVVETVGSEMVNGAMRIGAEAGSGSWITVDALTLGSVLTSKEFKFWTRFKIAAFSASENEYVRIGLRESSTYNGFLELRALYSETNYLIAAKPNSSWGEQTWDTGVALPTGGASSGWMDLEFSTYGTGEAATWRLASQHVVQAHGTVTAFRVPTNGINFSCRCEKLGTGSRLTQLYTDIWSVAQNV